MSNTKNLLGFNLDKAYGEYRKRISGRIKYVESTLGGAMYDGNAKYDKGTFAAIARELMGKNNILEATPGETAKLVINYQSYGDFTYQQAEALKAHYEATTGLKMSIQQARSKSREISDYYNKLKQQGYSIEEAKKEVSWIFFGSK